MYFKIENEENIAKVKEFLEKEGITHISNDSCHELVVKDEAEFLRNSEMFDDIIEEWDLTEDELKTAKEILDEIFDEIIEDSQAIVLEDYSFLNVQESIENKVRNEVVERFNF